MQPSLYKHYQWNEGRLSRYQEVSHKGDSEYEIKRHSTYEPGTNERILICYIKLGIYSATGSGWAIYDAFATHSLLIK